jgi:hypothetical protein
MEAPSSRISPESAEKAGDQIEHSGLVRAARPQQRYECSGGDCERDVVDRLGRTPCSAQLDLGATRACCEAPKFSSPVPTGRGWVRAAVRRWCGQLSRSRNCTHYRVKAARLFTACLIQFRASAAPHPNPLPVRTGRGSRPSAQPGWSGTRHPGRAFPDCASAIRAIPARPS